MVIAARLAAITGAAGLALGGIGGWSLHNRMVYVPHLKQDTQDKLNAEQSARKVEGTGTTIATKFHQHLDTQKEALAATTVTLIKAIPLYVPAHTPSALAIELNGPDRGVLPRATSGLPDGFVRLHDYAALGIDPPVPTPTGIDLTRPTGIELPQLSSTLIGNYGQALQWRAEVLTWRAWYKEQCKAWEVARKDRVAEAGCGN